jgi:phosphomethylpyrimidine synthase
MSTRREALPSSTAAEPAPIAGSRKVYVTGPHGMRVPFREIALSATRSADGRTELNPPLRVYDTSGPYTDPAAAIDLYAGLPELRMPWILARGEYDRSAPSRQSAPALALTRRREALRGRGNVTQMHFARKGEVTPEMEFVALREGLAPEYVRDESPEAGRSSRRTSTTPRPSRWPSAATSSSRSTRTSATPP